MVKRLLGDSFGGAVLGPVGHQRKFLRSRDSGAPAAVSITCRLFEMDRQTGRG